jgi:hypothetical protein
MSSDNILGVIGLLCLVVFVAWDMRPAIERSAGKVILRYAWWVRCFFLASAFVIPLGITLLGISKEPKNPADLRAFIGLYALFAVLSVPSWWMTTRFSLTITAAGLECRSPWRGRRFVAWDEVVALTPSQAIQWHILQTSSGYRFCIPNQGVPGLTLLQEMVDRLAPNRKPGTP